MQSLGYISKLHCGGRGIALVLLLALVLTPSCSTVCPAQNCPISQPAEREAGCHHEAAMNSDDSATITAASASCGLHELPIALPEGRSLLDSGAARANSANLAATAATATYADSSDSSLSRAGGLACRSLQSAAKYFSFDTFVSLRI